jgi:hypothetical protein
MHAVALQRTSHCWPTPPQCACLARDAELITHPCMLHDNRLLAHCRRHLLPVQFISLSRSCSLSLINTVSHHSHVTHLKSQARPQTHWQSRKLAHSLNRQESQKSSRAVLFRSTSAVAVTPLTEAEVGALQEASPTSSLGSSHSVVSGRGCTGRQQEPQMSSG